MPATISARLSIVVLLGPSVCSEANIRTCPGRLADLRGIGTLPARSWCRALRQGLLVQREADRRQHRRDDPEAQDDLRLRPRPQLEVMVDRRHQEDALAA